MSSCITFVDILSRFDGPSDFARQTGAELEAAKQIFKRKSIPAHYGMSIVGAGKASPEEILKAAASKRARQST